MVTVAEKLKVTPGMTLLTINAPADFRSALSLSTTDVRFVTTGNGYQQIHWFVINKKQLDKELSRVMKLVKEGIVVWVYYFKGSSGLQTDLRRDKGWDCLLSEGDKLTWINLISFNSVWSVFGFRAKTDADKMKLAKPKETEIFKWINPKTEEINLPEDFGKALRKSNLAAAYFHALSFTNRKEYLEWM